MDKQMNDYHYITNHCSNLRSPRMPDKMNARTRQMHTEKGPTRAKKKKKTDEIVAESNQRANCEMEI